MKIAIIGTGISGLGAAHVLHPQHEVHCFEKESYVGGHSHTVDADGQPVDTGFIVYNERNYPKLTRLFRELKVETIPSDMSFGVYHPQADFAYASHGLTSLLASPKNLVSSRFYRMLYDVIRFNRLGRKLVAGQRHTDLTLADFLRQNGFSEAFEAYYITPMSAAIWSAPPGKTLGFPVLTFMRFFQNHGLLSVAPSIPWRTVKGGSRAYVEKLIRPFADRVYVNRPVALVRRGKEQVYLSFDDGPELVFDRVILATHADQALALLANPTDEEKRLLKLFPYQKNTVVLHNDVSVLPPHRRAWASWNVTVPARREAGAPLAMTYDMNRLQKIAGATRYLVTLNPDPAWLDRLRAASGETRVFFETEYEHPAYETDSFRVQQELASLNGPRLTCFGGAYCGYGFHEDGLAAGVRAAEALGGAW